MGSIEPESSTSVFERNVNSFTLNLQSAGDIQNFCGKLNTETHCLFEVAWAVLMRCYEYSDTVNFACFATSAIGKNQDIGHKQPLTTCIRYSPISETLSVAAAIQNSTSCRRSGHPIGTVTEKNVCDVGNKIDDEHLTLYLNLVTNGDATIEFWISHDTSKVSRWQAMNIATSFDIILSSILENDQQGISDITTIGRREWGFFHRHNEDIPVLRASYVHQIVSQRALMQPQAQAIASWDGNMTYSELDDLSSRLACYLMNLGVKAETFVPLRCEKSTWAIVGRLAVLKAGGACLTLDPAHPILRQKEMIRVSGAHVALATSNVATGLDELVDQVVILERSLFEKIPSDLKPVSVDIDPSNTAFVVFTSGSTGKPKGIMQSHEAFCSGLHDLAVALSLDNQSRLLQFVAYSFDISNNDIFAALAYGSCICIPSEYDRLNDLVGVVNRFKVNVACLTPTVANLLSPEEIPTLKKLMLAGEAVTQHHLDVWASKVHLSNLYGPAECAIWATLHPHMNETTYPTNIGWSATGRCWIVDPKDPDKLASLGATGEILIEGPHVASGYLGDPEKTASVFIPPPSWLPQSMKSQYSRFYLTGDLAHLTENGSFIYDGRKDTQVKISGQRIELQEIEHHLRQCLPRDTQSTVEIIKPNNNNPKPTLAAFIVFKNKSMVDEIIAWSLSSQMADLVPQLERALAQFLPPYMLPSVYIPIWTVPMTLTGKIDRRLLREIGSKLSVEDLSQLSTLADDEATSASNTELVLKDLWAEVLKVNAKHIRPNDHFVRLGGDSIAAIRLVTLARAQGLLLSVAEIFEHPILSQMGRSTNLLDDSPNILGVDEKAFENLFPSENLELKAIAAALCSTTLENVEDVYPCTPLQEGLMALSAKHPGAYVARHIMRLASNVNITTFKSAWEMTVNTTRILRTRMTQTDTAGWLQVVVRETIVWDTIDDLEVLSEASIPAMNFGDRLNFFAISGSEDKGFQFVWTSHHAIYDGWTLPLILTKVARIYQEMNASFSANVNFEEREPYRKFIRFIFDNDHKQSDKFWHKYLSGARLSSAFPVPIIGHSPRPNASISMDIDLQRPILSAFTTPTLIRAAWALVASSHCASNDIIFGATLAGRNVPIDGIESLLGPTITTVPVRVVLHHKDTISSLLERLQSQNTSMIPFEHTGIQNIRRISADAAAACDFQCLLIIQPQLQEEQETYRILFEEDNINTSNIPGHLTYPMTLECTIKSSGLTLTSTFDSDLIHSIQMRRLLNQLQYVLRQLVQMNDYTSRIQDIEVLSPEDKVELDLWGKIEPQQDYESLHAIISQHALAFPSHQAVCSWDYSLTYLELEKLSARLADYLIGLGIATTMVPLYFERSAWAIVAMLAVLKAGAAFVFIDISYPISRLRAIAESLQPTIILTSERLKDIFSSENNILEMSFHTFTVASHTLKELGSPESGRTTHQTMYKSSSMAYYTLDVPNNGDIRTTGHQNHVVSGRLLGLSRTLQLKHNRILQYAPYGANMSIDEILCSLISGGCLCIPSESERINLPKFIATKDVDSAFLTPSLARSLSPQSIPSLQLLLLAMESPSFDVIEIWAPKVKLYAAYVLPGCGAVTAISPLSSATSAKNIGKFIGYRPVVSDVRDSARLVPIGAIGELFLRGAVSAEEHANQGKGSQYWQTGDLVRYNYDGALTYVGSKRTALKLHGQVIEPEIVESFIRQRLPPQHNVVVASYQSHGEAVLAALISFKDQPKSMVSDGIAWACESQLLAMIPDLVDSLSQYLPEYLQPSVFVPVLNLSFNSVGQLDRDKAQQILGNCTSDQLDSLSLKNRSIVAPPGSDIEIRLQKVWSSVLNVLESDIRYHDHFFRLGGDSTSAMRLVAAARSQRLSLTVGQVFDHPTLRGMAKVAEGMISEREELAPFELVGGTSEIEEVIHEVARTCGIDPALVEDIYPATALQEGLMVLSHKHAGSYIGQYVVQIDDSIDIPRFQEAWQRTVDDTPILRTRIIQSRTLGSLQAVLHQKLDWEIADQLDDLLRRHKRQRMGYGDQLNSFAIVMNKDTKVFVWTSHHSIYDGWTNSMILEKVTQLYWTPDLIIDGFQFNRFVQYATTLERGKAFEFWHDQLVGGEPCNFLCRDTGYLPRPDSRLTQWIDLQRKPQSYLTTSTLIRAAWSILLSRYTSSSDVVFGVVVSGRNAPIVGVDRIVGPTIATVPIRHRHNSEETVAKFLENVQAHATSMIPYEQTGLQEIQRMGTEARAACNFDNLLVVQPSFELGAEQDPKIFISGDLNAMTEDLGFFTYALTIVCELSKAGFTASAVYDSTLISTEQMRRVLMQFDCILQQLCNGEDGLRLQDITLLSQEDMEDIMRWNQQSPEVFENHSSVHQLIEQHKEAIPDAPAICSWDGNLTYAELDNMSSRLAHQLRQYLISNPPYIPMLFEKSMWAVVSMVAILKAGGAFVPLDPSQPASRLQTILRELKPTVILTSHMHESIGSSLASAFEDCFAVLPVSAALMTNLVLPMDPYEVSHTDMAYILYTSGSTGEPKGVMLDHRNVCSGTKAFGPALLLNSNSRALQFSSYTFDTSIAEIFGCLIMKGCICIPSDEERMDNIAGAVKRMGVNWAFLTPSVVRILNPEQFPSLETICLGGEPLTQDIMDRWNINIIQGYGPTESTVLTTINDMTNSTKAPNNIGRAVGCRTWIVDAEDHKKLMPIGLTGELLVEGPAVACGYLDKEKTRTVFVDRPSWIPDSPYKKLYKTGDLVKYDPDGSIRFIARKDNQVKLRGQRMELDEIQHHLRNIDMISDTFVDLAVPSDGPREQVLIAWVSLHHTAKFNVSSTELSYKLNRELSLVLPKYMVPSVFIPLKVLPVTSSGKIDRKTLRAQAMNMTVESMSIYTVHDSKETRPPTRPNETQLQELWSRVLKREKSSIGLDDNFFQLGGDSITAMKLVAAARAASLVLTVAGIFQNSTLEKMAQIITVSADSSIIEVAHPSAAFESNSFETVREEVLFFCQSLKADDIEDIYPCTPLQEGLVTLSTRRPEAYMEHRVINLTGVDIARFMKAWELLVESTPILRTAIVQISTGCFQVVLKNQFCWNKASDLERYLQENCVFRADVSKPLNEATLIINEDGKPESFVWIAHHAVYDGWSLRLLFERLDQMYYGSCDNPCTLQGSSSYKHFINYIYDSPAEEAQKFWQLQLADANPSEFPARISGYSPIPDEFMALDVELTRTTGSEITTSTLIRAAWSILLSQYCATEDVVFAATMAGRTAPIPDIETLMGPTITTVPVRVNIDAGLTVIEFMRQLQTQSAEMMPYEHFGLRNIRHILHRSEARAACDSQHLLVIQPYVEPEDTNTKSLHPINADTLTDEVPHFHTYPLTVDCSLTKNGTRITANFDSKIIGIKKMKRVLYQFQHLIRELAHRDLKTPLSDLELISDQDKEELRLWLHNDLEPSNTCIHHLISERARIQPDSEAICSWDGNLSYIELEDYSNKLACHLVSLGLKRGTPVPVCFEKSYMAVVCKLAVLKAGGSSVSLDPSHPHDRQENIINQSRPSLLIVSVGAASRLTGFHIPKLVVTAPFLQNLGSSSFETLESVGTGPQDTAFIVFTSGSTGMPKGILQSHSAFCSSVRDFGSSMNLNQSSRILQFASYTFDVSNNDIWPTLIHGGCVCVPSEQERINDLPQTIEKLRANTACLTPTVASMFTPSQVPSLKILGLAGEAIMKENIEDWANSVQLMNIYGPAECTICCTCLPKLEPLNQAAIASHPASIGYSMTGKCWIVEPGNPKRLSPIGCVGELLIEGPHLANGYLHNEQKTNQVFINQPSWFHTSTDKHLSTKYYLTGDLAKYDTEGEIIYLGRKDTQVKLAGQRIELEEIEHHIRKSLPALVNTIVDVVQGKDKKSATKLVAFIIFDPIFGSSNTDGIAWEMQERLASLAMDIRGRLSQLLPSYMHPSLYVPLWKIPLSPSGKTDRRQLRQMATKLRDEQFSNAARESDETPQSSMSDISCRLGKLWTKILGLERGIGLDEDFFQLGGDSVSAMRLVAAARTDGLTMTVAQIFENPSLASMSSIIINTSNPEVNEPPASRAVDLLAEFKLAQRILFEAYNVRHGRNVFLTGATGYLGTQILRELILRPDIGTVFAHVRAPTVTEGLQRVIGSAKLARWWQDSFLSKVEVWIGDLAKPKIGLDDDQWSQLDGSSERRHVDAIIHNGAVVNWNKNFEALKTANIMSTIDLLRATMASATTKFVYVSGGQQFEEKDEQNGTYANLEQLGSSIGYAQTKYVSELLVRECGRVLNKDQNRVSIIKPGLIIGTETEGVPNLDDFLWRVVAATVRVGGYNADDGRGWLSIASADYIAKKIIQGIDEREATESIATVIDNGLAVQDLWDILIHDLNYDLKPMSREMWLKSVQQDVHGDDTHPLWPVLHFIENDQVTLGEEKSDKAGRILVTQQIKSAIKKNVETLVSVGYLPTSNGEKISVRSQDGFRRTQV